MSKKQSDVSEIRRIAQERLGYEGMRPGQEAAILSLLEGRDTLAVMPTGSGKSAIYQIAGDLIEGPTVVISPLIALQRDQTEFIEQQDVGQAARVNSTLSAGQREEAFEGLEQGALEYLFLAPEQFTNEETLEHLRQARPSLFVIDEAHCISEWGHDFRPQYLRLGAFIEELGHPTVLALTATAAPPVREEIVQRLGMNDPRIIVQGFDRPNIWLGVARFADEDAKAEALLERVKSAPKPGILYCATRKHAEKLGALLNDHNLGAVVYHAGLKKSEREEAQSAFMSDKAEVIAATKAFGMGIDKPNVRFVYHYDISDAIDTYYQEVGRAGRDGEPSEALLFYVPQDMNVQRFLASSGKLEADDVERVIEAVQEHDEPVDTDKLHEETGLSVRKLTTVLNGLEEAGVVETLPGGEILHKDEVEDPGEVAEEAAQRQERHRQVERSRLDMMQRYADLRSCYREYLLNYFGEELEPPCNNCANCERGHTQKAMEQSHEGEELPFPLNSQVKHTECGEGVVMRYEGNKIVVLFNEVGYKTLAIEIVVERGLLEPVE